MADSDEISIAVDDEMAAELQKLVESVSSASAGEGGPKTAVVKMNKEAAARLFSRIANGILEAAAITSRPTDPNPPPPPPPHP